MRTAFAIAALILLVTPLAWAQEHAHGGGNGAAMVLFDGPPDGRAVVGAYTHFGFALLDKDAAPLPHQNAEFVVMQDGAVLFSSADTHEYDGLFSFDLRFTKPGAYQVVAMSGDMQMGAFEGEVIAPVNATVAHVELTATPQGPGSRLVDFEVSILGPGDALLQHTDAIVELRETQSGALASRHHLHVHDAPIRFTQGLGPATDYTAQVIGYQAFNRGRAPDVPAVVAQFPVGVGPVALPGAPMPELAAPAPLEQRGAVVTADGLTLHATYDPNNQVGLGQTARIAGTVVEDANHSTKQHVDFALMLSGPRGLVFSSENGHEYDGVFEFLFVPDAPGEYDGTLTATYDETVLAVPIHLLVVPPAVPLLGGTGPIEVSVDGLDAIVAGEATNITFRAMGPAGPAMHSEVDVTIFHAITAGEDEPPLYQFKLHTHDSGLTNAIVVFPHEGEWQMRVDPLPTVPEASVYAPALFAFDVGKAATETAGAAIDAPPVAAKVPAPGLGLLLVAGLVALALGRRR